VKVSKDLRFAKIFLIHNISEAEFEIFTKKYQHEIQNVVARNLTSKYTPRVALIFDQTFSESLKVQSLLDSLS
jgi:ribosome-binding factor A